ETENLQHPFLGSNWSIGSIVSALFACLFAYDGWDILNFGAEEIEKPKRTMPLAIVIGMVCIALIYVAVNFAYFIVLSPAQILSSDAVAMVRSFRVRAGIWIGGFAFYWVFLFGRALPSSAVYTEYSNKANNSTTKWAQIIFDLMPERGDESEINNAITVVNDK
ncbi:hypothetical protein TELCIR_18584, partial [Teladorsagia circumcincta]